MFNPLKKLRQLRRKPGPGCDAASGIFDRDWYLTRYPEVARSGLEPYRHFLEIGWRAGFDPHPLFATGWYRDTVPASAGHNPLLHFLQSPLDTIADPHPLFDAAGYLRRYPDVRKAGVNPLAHYLEHGAREGRRPHLLFDPQWYAAHNAVIGHEPLLHYLSGGGTRPHPLFDDEWYRLTYAEAGPFGAAPLVDYVVRGHRLGRQPHPLFDPYWYAASSTAEIPTGSDPLQHYLSQGWQDGGDPHPLFSLKSYLAANPGVVASGVEPLQHYLDTGWRESRNPHPLFSPSDYLLANPDILAAGLEPLSHYVSVGWREKRPGAGYPLFDAAWYLQAYPEVEASDQNPLLHFVTRGAAQGRNPNPLFDTHWYRDQHETRLSGENALVHYVTKGAQEERAPSRYFDRDYYLAHNPDVYDSGKEPFAHFLQSGVSQGRHGRAPDSESAACNVLDIPYELRRAPGPALGKDVCLFVTYTRDGFVHNHVLHQIDAYRRHGFMVVVVLATDGLDRPIHLQLRSTDGLIVRGNHGWDFAAWAAGLSIIPDLWSARTVILANDSVYGPIGDTAFAKVLSRVRSSDADLVALTDSRQVVPHLMSYFIAITQAGLAKEAIRNYWNGVRSLRNKQEVINAYVLTPLASWQAGAVSCEVLFPTADDVVKPLNPTLASWRDLVGRGFPFLKAQLLRDNLPQVDPNGWQTFVDPRSGLVSMIEEHLEHSWRPVAQRHRRPIPAPRRRFDRRFRLSTSDGATPSIRPTEDTDLALGLPFRFAVPDHVLPHSIAIIAHVFYPELAAEILTYIGNVPTRADLFVTTDTTAKAMELKDIFSAYQNGSVEVRVVPNVGRDIAAMVVGCRDVVESYEIILHVHSKRSIYNDKFAGWRRHLLDTLLGSTEIVRSIICLLREDRVGIVFPQHFHEVRPLLNWGNNFALSKLLLNRAGVELSKDLVLEFPSGSFFWGRSAAFKSLLDLGLNWSDFPEKAGQVDGTVAHAIERSILFFAEADGYRWAKVATEVMAHTATILPIFDKDELRNGLMRLGRPLVGNRLIPLRERQILPELTPIATRRDPDLRPRLNLVLPTLHPAHVFGGITTALRIFEQICDACGPHFTRRILVGYIPLDLSSMATTPDYKLILAGSPYDDVDKSVVDLTDFDGGELPIRKNDIFVATAWWTASQARDLVLAQQRYYASSHQLIYFVQDHEPGFYPWSEKFAQASETYTFPDDVIALFNSEELANYFADHYNFQNASVIRYAPNKRIRNCLTPQLRERIILIYGRPGAPRNCFETICRGLLTWQQSEPVRARHWQIISVGQAYPPHQAGRISNLRVLGKLSLKDYADVLSRSSVGISLMLSPHPSYPPLEMAHAGLRTITNSFETKDMACRSANCISLQSITSTAIAAALTQATKEAENSIGRIRSFSEIAQIDCDLPDSIRNRWLSV